MIKILKTESLENAYDRQNLISWWSQEKINNARILVIGAGAIGNEVIKNLCLIGFGNIMICDMDVIETSNLSRTVLFSKDDVGKYKAEVAAQRAREMSIYPDIKVDYFIGNVVHELGTGVFRQFDIVLGCLDNLECRLEVNHRCNKLGLYYIDGGIMELTAGVKVFHYPESSCFACSGISGYANEISRRYSCARKKRKLVMERKAPTIQISTAISGALIVQEAAKIINGQFVDFGKNYVFEGLNNSFEAIRIRKNDDCMYHQSYNSIINTNFTVKNSLNDILKCARGEKGKKNFVLDMSDNYNYSFTKEWQCRQCGKMVSCNKPTYMLYEEDCYCEECKRSYVHNALEHNVLGDDIDISILSDQDSILAAMTLEELGIPKGHIITIRNKDDEDECYYYELGGDLPKVLNEIEILTK